MLARRCTQGGICRNPISPRTFLPPSLTIPSVQFTTSRKLSHPPTPYPTLSPTPLRQLSITPLTPSQSHEILSAQRLSRPTSPNLRIYKPQITSILSISHRITGLMLAVPFYGFGLAYLGAGFLGMGFDTQALVEGWVGLGGWVRGVGKFLIAFPFTFHAFNGVRHLVWDLGKQMTNRQVIRSGWLVVGLSVSSALGLAAVW